MSDDPEHDPLDARLRAAAVEFSYPPTPDLAAARRRRQTARSASARLRPAARLALALAALLAALLAVPDVRATALRLLQVGVVRVRVEPGPPPPTPAAPAPRLRLPDLAGATSLEAAAPQLPFPIQLPAYPPELGPPAAVFIQDISGPALVTVWADPLDPSRAALSLHALSPRAYAEKLVYGGGAEQLAETEVNGAAALWVRGPHLLRARQSGGDEFAVVRIVDGNTLIWTSGDVTFRLESDLPLDEARRVAESLRPLEP